MDREDALDLVGMLGADLRRHKRGLHYVKALLVLIGSSEHPAQDVAGALEAPDDLVEAAHDDVRALTYQEYGQRAAFAAHLARKREQHLREIGAMEDP